MIESHQDRFFLGPLITYINVLNIVTTNSLKEIKIITNPKFCNYFHYIRESSSVLFPSALFLIQMVKIVYPSHLYHPGCPESISSIYRSISYLNLISYRSLIMKIHISSQKADGKVKKKGHFTQMCH